jgi:hypothetical protein
MHWQLLDVRMNSAVSISDAGGETGLVERKLQA